MRIVVLGDAAVLAELGDLADEAAGASVRRLTEVLRRTAPPRVCDIVPSYTTVAVHFAPESAAGRIRAEIVAWIERCGAEIAAGPVPTARATILPACFDREFAPDLAEAARTCGLSEDDFVARFLAADFEVRALGFSPGFPYLAGLPPELAVPRRANPRTRVPAGSVAIGAGQAGIYPSATPGGWNLIGRTPACLFDPRSEPPNRLAVGDRVRFTRVSASEFEEKSETPDHAPSGRPGGEPLFTVMQGGLFSTVQDLGATGHEAAGVSAGGAADRLALRIANLLVGNDESAAGLECTLRGPVLAFHRATRVAVTGTPVEGIPWARPIDIRAGDTLSLRRLAGGCRAYLAVAGGIAAEEILGSRGTRVRMSWGGFAGRALRTGDVLGTDPAGPDFPAEKRVRRWHVSPRLALPPRAEPTVRIVAGPQREWFGDDAWRLLTGESFRVSNRSDRMGARLEGPKLLVARPREMVSEAVVDGSIQVPPSGDPIVLLTERQTLGGYPKIANVISADLGLIAQLRPGDRVRFAAVELAAADAGRAGIETDLQWLRAAIRQKEVGAP